MRLNIPKAVASAEGLDTQDREIVYELLYVWQKHHSKNLLRDNYYNGDIKTKDLGITISPKISKRLNNRIDWAAKCVNWWADRVQFEGFNVLDEDAKDILYTITRLNDFDNVVRKAVMCSLRHSVSFMTVTKGSGFTEPPIVISAYPATASSALWNDGLKRIDAGMVVVDSEWNKTYSRKYPRLIYVFTDTDTIVLTRVGGSWYAEKGPHSMGRVPMEPIVYHATLERPFGSSRISETVMSLVNAAQREMANMEVTASFAAAPQRYLMAADKSTIDALKDSPFAAYIGALFTATLNPAGGTPTYGQLPQLSMQPHSDYMKLLASMFSDATNVPLGALGFNSVNPTSAETILAAKEDAVIDINSYILACKRSLSNIAAMTLAAEQNTSFYDVMNANDISAIFADPATPSAISMSTTVQTQVATFPWMKDSNVPLRALGYKDDVLRELQMDRRKAEVKGILAQQTQAQPPTQGVQP